MTRLLRSTDPHLQEGPVTLGSTCYQLSGGYIEVPDDVHAIYHNHPTWRGVIERSGFSALPTPVVELASVPALTLDTTNSMAVSGSAVVEVTPSVEAPKARRGRKAAAAEAPEAAPAPVVPPAPPAEPPAASPPVEPPTATPSDVSAASAADAAPAAVEGSPASAESTAATPVAPTGESLLARLGVSS